jgi:hypothetical protein
MRRSLWIGLFALCCSIVAAGLLAQSAPGHKEYGPFFCTAFCSLQRLDPGNGTTMGDTNLQNLLDNKSQAYSAVSGDTLIVCNGFNCAVYKKTDSGEFTRTKIEKEFSTPPGSEEPPGNSGQPPQMNGSGSGSNIPLTYWPTSTSKCVKATVSGPTGSNVQVYCG